jgi:hypothetical protein
MSNSNDGSQLAQVWRICRDVEQVFGGIGLSVRDANDEITTKLPVQRPQKLRDCLIICEPAVSAASPATKLLQIPKTYNLQTRSSRCPPPAG